MIEKKDSRTELSALGEFGLIHELQQIITTKNPSTIKGIGDDCAVLDHGGKKLLLTSDMLLEKIHFDLAYICIYPNLSAFNSTDVYPFKMKRPALSAGLVVTVFKE